MRSSVLAAFQDEMRKMAEESLPDDEAARLKAARRARAKAAHEGNVRTNKATLGLLGANLGAYAAVMALLKGSAQPQDAKAMRAYVQQMAKDMKLPEDVKVHAPGSSHPGGWSPFYDPNGNAVNIPLGTRDSIIAHELGHAKNDMLASGIGKGLRNAYQGLQTVSRVGSSLSLLPTLTAAAKDKEMSLKPGVIQAILSAPMIAEEAAASARATAHLIRQHGVGKGVWKSLPLVPAFATYATIAGAPLLVTYLRRRAAEKQSKEKKSAADYDSEMGFFERHPKKLLGGALAAGAGGLMLLKGKKAPAAAVRSVATHAPSAKTVTKTVAKPATKTVVPSKPTPKPKEWDWEATGPDRKMPVQAYRRDPKAPAVRHPAGRHEELQSKAKMERKIQDEVVRAHDFARKHAMVASPLAVSYR